MQNTTTQPQNFYTKPAMPAPAPQVNPEQPSTPKKSANKNKSKKIFAVAGLVLFLIVAIMGVAISQRQVAKPGEEVALVAPNAPTSQPAASTAVNNQCSTKFTVTGKNGVCDNKTAFTDFTNKTGSKEIPAGSSFNPGDEFVFVITVKQPEDGLAENIEVTDELPASLAWVGGPTPADPAYTVTHTGQKVTATIPSMKKGDEVNIEFKVKVNDSNYGVQLNTALVKGAEDLLSCTYGFETFKGTTECISKEIYDTEGVLMASGSALTRGETYEYRINIAIENRFSGEVNLFDKFPEALEYVGPTPESEDYIIEDLDNGIITANLDVITDLADDTLTLGFLMKVPENIEPTELDNIAYLYDLPVDADATEPPANEVSQCTASNVILPIGTAECVSKEAFRIDDVNNPVAGAKIVSGGIIDKGDHFLYRITVKADQTTTGSVIITDNLPEGLSYIKDDINSSEIEEVPEGSGNLVIDLGTMTTGQEKEIEFLVQLDSNPTEDTFNNVAVVTTNEDDDNSHSCSLPLELKKDYICNSECETDDQCKEIGDDHICNESTKTCRLEENPGDENCQPEVTPPPTTVPPTTPPATPAIGCNDLCTQNADCTNIDHVCVTTTKGGELRCRLEDYPDSTTCSEPQPELPETLPETGPADWLNWLKAGLVTMGIGTALFLLL